MELIVDIALILLLIVGAFLGFKRGAVKTTFSFISLVIAIIIATIFTSPLSKLFYKFLPFFDFGGELKGAYVLNIILYKVIAFFVIFSILLVIVRLVSFIGNTIEKALKTTIVLEIPSKILGIVVGALEMYVYLFIIVYILSLPMLRLTMVQNSSISKFMINKTPLLSNSVGKTIDAFNELYELNGEYESVESYNRETMKVILKYNITDKETIKVLIDSNKLKNCDVDDLLK